MAYLIAGLLLAAIVYFMVWRKSRARVVTPIATTARIAQIPPAVRAELDDKPEFWDRRFHQLLAAVHAESVVGEQIDTYSWGGDLIMTWEDRGYVDCPCRKCRRICA